MLLGSFGRRLLEVLFDGKLEAAADVESQAVRHTATPAKEPALAAGLAKRFSVRNLADLAVQNQDDDGFEFVVGERRCVLIIRDGQHEYVFTEAA
jgi:hypothetical protein